MKEFDEIRRLWHRQPAKPVSIEDIFTRMNDEKRDYASKLLVQTIGIAIALLSIVYVWLIATFITWTSHLSMMIVISCLIYYLKIQITDYRKINKTAFLFKKPEEYIAYLKNYKKSRFKLNTKSYQLYVLLISISLGLFSVEMYYVLSFPLLLTYIVMSAGWVLLCQFVFMKQYNKREELRLQAIINSLERLSKQFIE